MDSLLREVVITAVAADRSEVLQSTLPPIRTRLTSLMTSSTKEQDPGLPSPAPRYQWQLRKSERFSEKKNPESWSTFIPTVKKWADSGICQIRAGATGSWSSASVSLTGYKRRRRESWVCRQVSSLPRMSALDCEKPHSSPTADHQAEQDPTGSSLVWGSLYGTIPADALIQFILSRQPLRKARCNWLFWLLTWLVHRESLCQHENPKS